MLDNTDRAKHGVVKAAIVEEQYPATVVALVNDLFFSVKLGNQIKLAGYTPHIVKSAAEFREALTGPRVALGVVDLSSRTDVNELRPTPAHDRGAIVPIIAFGPHKDVDAFRDAKAAGLTRVMSNSQFHAQTVEMIRRYARPAGADEER